MFTDPEYLSTGAVAKILRCSQQNVIKLCNRGALPTARMPYAGSHRFITKTSLRRFLAAHPDIAAYALAF